MFKYLTVFFIFFAFSIFSETDSSWFKNGEEGWHWYKESLKEEKLPEVQEETYKKAEKNLEKFKDDLQNKKLLAMSNPSYKNVKDYMLLQKQVFEKSEKFSKIWELVLLDNPELSTDVENPSTQFGIQLNNKIKEEKNRFKLEEAFKKLGLVFFYEGNSLYSQALKASLENLKKSFSNLEIIGVSLDGHIFDSFSDASGSNLEESFSLKTKPSVYLVNPLTYEKSLVAYGMQSTDQLVRNILVRLGES